MTLTRSAGAMERIPCAGDVPTPEEWLRYSVERLKEDGREDLLRHYLID